MHYGSLAFEKRRFAVSEGRASQALPRSLREAVREGWERPGGRRRLCARSQVSVCKAQGPARPATRLRRCARNNGTKKDTRVVTVASAHSSLAAPSVPFFHIQHTASRSVLPNGPVDRLNTVQKRVLGGPRRFALFSCSSFSGGLGVPLLNADVLCSWSSNVQPLLSCRAWMFPRLSQPHAPHVFSAVTLRNCAWIDITPPPSPVLHSGIARSHIIPPLAGQQRRQRDSLLRNLQPARLARLVSLVMSETGKIRGDDCQDRWTCFLNLHLHLHSVAPPL